MAAENFRLACVHKARRAATWILKRTEADDGVAQHEPQEAAIEVTEELDLDQRFDTYLDLTMEEDPSRAWFTA
jgi:hypothetical protein